MVMANTVDTTVRTNSATAASTSKDQEQAIADFDTFLKLLTAQLKNQDPLNPQDGTEFTSQLAQFSSLEQQINTNEHLKTIIKDMPNTDQEQALSYIGKDVLIPGNAFILGQTGNVEFTYDVNLPIKSATVNVYNSAGEKVRDFNVESSEGIHDILWDGRDAEGNRLDAGTFTVKVEGHGAINEKGEIYDPKLESYFYSTAEKVTKLGDEFAIMTIDGRTVKADKVLAVRDSSVTSAKTSSEQHSTALQMLGKQVLMPGSDFTYSGQDIGFTYGITKDIQAVAVKITDAEGNSIKQAPFDASKGSHEFVWDGTDSNGDSVQPGKYKIEIKGQDIDSEGKIVEENLDTFFYGTADKVESKDGIVLIYTSDGRKAFYDEIISTKD